MTRTGDNQAEPSAPDGGAWNGIREGDREAFENFRGKVAEAAAANEPADGAWRRQMLESDESYSCQLLERLVLLGASGPCVSRLSDFVSRTDASRVAAAAPRLTMALMRGDEGVASECLRALKGDAHATLRATALAMRASAPARRRRIAGIVAESAQDEADIEDECDLYSAFLDGNLAGAKCSSVSSIEKRDIMLGRVSDEVVEGYIRRLEAGAIIHYGVEDALIFLANGKGREALRKRLARIYLDQLKMLQCPDGGASAYSVATEWRYTLEAYFFTRSEASAGAIRRRLEKDDPVSFDNHPLAGPLVLKALGGGALELYAAEADRCFNMMDGLGDLFGAELRRSELETFVFALTMLDGEAAEKGLGWLSKNAEMFKEHKLLSDRGLLTLEDAVVVAAIAGMEGSEVGPEDVERIIRETLPPGESLKSHGEYVGWLAARLFKLKPVPEPEAIASRLSSMHARFSEEGVLSNAELTELGILAAAMGGGE